MAKEDPSSLGPFGAAAGRLPRRRFAARGSGRTADNSIDGRAAYE